MEKREIRFFVLLMLMLITPPALIIGWSAVDKKIYVEKCEGKSEIIGFKYSGYYYYPAGWTRKSTESADDLKTIKTLVECKK